MQLALPSSISSITPSKNQLWLVKGADRRFAVATSARSLLSPFWNQQRPQPERAGTDLE